jgi:hypothetical protein
LKRLILGLCMTLMFALGSFAGTKPSGGGHGSGHAPEMTSVTVVLAGLTSLGGYLAIRRRATRKK